MILKSPKQVFKEEGFILTEDLFSFEERYFLDVEFQKIRETKKNIGELYDTVHSLPSFLRIISGHRLLTLLTSLVDSPLPPFCFVPRLRIDPPFDDRKTYGWHQEVYYSPPRANIIQLWAPVFHDATKRNGTLEIIPRSHNYGILSQNWEDVADRATQIIVNEEKVEELAEKHGKITVELKQGDALLFDGNLVHRSGVNKSELNRYTITCMYIDPSSCKTPGITFNWRGQSPREYYDENHSLRTWIRQEAQKSTSSFYCWYTWSYGKACNRI